MTTALAARQNVAGALLDALTVPVYDHEPRPGGLPKPLGVSCATAGMSATEHLIAVRVYSSLTAGDVSAAQDSLTALMEQADTALDVTACPRSTWQVVYEADLDCLVATTVVEHPRDDF